jgi:hypothetical protein
VAVSEAEVTEPQAVWALSSLRESLAAASVLGVLTVLLGLLVVAFAQGFGASDAVCFTVAFWVCSLVPLAVGALPLALSLGVHLRRGRTSLQVGGPLAATEMVLSLGLQVLVLQVGVLLWARALLPEFVETGGIELALVCLWWPLAIWVAVLAYCAAPKTRGSLARLAETEAKSVTARLLGMLWGAGITAVALFAVGNQAPVWAFGENASYWLPFFTLQCEVVAAIAVLAGLLGL